jgi:hypothetical protein
MEGSKSSANYRRQERRLVYKKTSIAIYSNNAEGGTRTRTAFWARGFSYHYNFRYLSPFSSLTVCGLDDAFSMHVSLTALFEQANKPCLGGSRLVSTLC